MWRLMAPDGRFLRLGFGGSTLKIVTAAAALAALSLSMAAASAANAAIWLANDGSAQADITVGANSLHILLTSLFANPTSAADEVSGIQITLGSAPGSVALNGTPSG